MEMRKVLFLTLILYLLFIPLTYATNLSISNVLLSNVSNGTADVTFDIDWDVSWRDSTNYDAVWLFLKYSTDNGATWHHGTFYSSGTNPTGYSTGTGIEIVVPSDQMGCFIQRSANGTGSVSVDNVKIRWYYGADGVTGTNDVEIKLFGIEMVYIPEGSFWLGDYDGDVDGCFRMKDDTTHAVNIDATMSYVLVCEDTSSDDATLETDGICIDGDGGLYQNDGATLINANFPTGYNAFYCMKYEITQSQYRDFLNTLTRTQQSTRTDANTAGEYMNNSTTLGYRNGVMCTDPNGDPNPFVYVCNFDGDTTYNETEDGENIACNYLSWADVTAYADWAGLRPMTELEFEKACRGPNYPADDEYAWGTSSVSDIDDIDASGYPWSSGHLTSYNCNYDHDGIIGPARAGICAAGATSREDAGASYYGVMELSGNVLERTVTVGNSTGRSFTPNNGDGELDSTGNPNVSGWPGTDAVGAGFRGGSWHNSYYIVRVSCRDNAADTYANRYYYGGGRCGRSAE